MSNIRLALSLTISLLVTGCGTYVPGLEEPLSSPVGGQLMVQSIVQNIDCEIRNAIGDIIRRDKEEVRTGFRTRRQTAWLDNWGVQSSLTLQVNETGAINPSAQWLPPSPATSIFTLAGAGSLSTTATRIEKMGSYYSVTQIVHDFRCKPEDRPGGLFLMQNDLKLREWLFDVIMLEGTGVAQIPPTKDVIQHQVTFEITSSGGLTPTWTLTRAVINNNGTFLQASRGRKHDLVITLGPVDPAQVVNLPAGPRLVRGRAGLASAAASAHLASEIGIAVSSAVRNPR